MKRHVLIVIGLLAFVLGGCGVQYKQTGVFADLEAKPDYVTKYYADSLAVGEEGVYTDPTTGTVYEGKYFVDPTGWSIDEVASIEDYFTIFMQKYEQQKTCPPCAKLYLRRLASGEFKIKGYAVENSPERFMVFAINFPSGMQLRWDENSSIELHVAEKKRHVVYVSRKIFFSKQVEFDLHYTRMGPILLAQGENWDIPERDIIAIAVFDFDGKRPNNILYCEVKNVSVAGSAVSVR